MPESMFGRPSQHLLPSNAPPSTGAVSSEAPVRAAAPAFKDFRFNSIGKQPELLSRISIPQQDHTDYHSPTPSPTSKPPPPSANDRASHPSRPTLLQQLAGSNFDSVTGSRQDALIYPPSGSLASRIQMNGSPLNDSNSPAHGMTSLLSLSSRVASVNTAKDASLIPPVEVLPQPPDSSSPTPTSRIVPLQQLDMHSPASSSPLNTMAMPTPPTTTTNIVSREPMASSPSITLVYPVMQDLQTSPSSAVSNDSLAARQEHLHTISAKLANLTPLLAPPSSQSPPPDPSSVTPTTSQSQSNSAPRVHRSHSTNQSSGLAGLNINNFPIDTNDPSLALVPSPADVVQEHQTQNRVIVEAIQNLNSVLSAARLAQMDNVKALELRMQVFDEQRAAFEQVKQMDEAALQQEFQELQQKREELNAKEASLASLEKERMAREEARKGVLAKRQAQEEEKRVAETRRVQEVQEQIAHAMKELKEIETLKAKFQAGQLACENVQSDLPTESMDGMDEEETAAIKSRNELLCAVKHLRRMLSDKMNKLEESGHTLRRLEDQRKQKEAKEAERRRIAAEERLQAQAEMERVRQVEEQKRRQLEVERRRQELEKQLEQARLLAEQQAHAEAQVLGAPGGQTRRPEEVSALQQQSIAETARIRMAGEENPPGTANTMDVDDTRTPFTPRPAVPILPDTLTSPGGSQKASPQSMQKKDKGKPTSGGDMLSALPPKPNGLPKSSEVVPSLSSVVANAPNPARTTPAIPISAGNARKSSITTQVISGHRRPDTDVHTPDRKPAFSRAPKSQTVLDAAHGESQELNIGPLSGVSPTQQTVNLRHLKRVRGHTEGRDNGDRSVRTITKSEERNYLVPKMEEQDVQSRELVQGSPHRLGVIPPPRPRAFRKRHHEVPASQTHPSNSRPTESSGLALTDRELHLATEQARDAPPSDSRTTTVPVQLPTLPETTKSLLLAPMHQEPLATEFRTNVPETPAQDRNEDRHTEHALTYELDGEDLSKGNKRLPDDPRRARNARRMPNHYSPPSQPAVYSPTQPHRLIDSWRPQNPPGGPRAEPMPAPSPITGRKRPSEFNDHEHGHRARRPRGDVWAVQDHDRERVDSYSAQWDGRLDTEPDERRAGYRPPAFPPDNIWAYPLEVPRVTYDNRTYVPPAPEELTAPHWEQPYRRTEGGDTYQRYQPPAPGYNAMSDQLLTDNVRVGQTYEPMVEERKDVRPDPSLLARMRDTQLFPPRGRGRGESSRARGDSGRGRGRGAPRTGPALIDRLTSGPSSLEDRLM